MGFSPLRVRTLLRWWLELRGECHSLPKQMIFQSEEGRRVPPPKRPNGLFQNGKEEEKKEKWAPKLTPRNALEKGGREGILLFKNLIWSSQLFFTISESPENFLPSMYQPWSFAAPAVRLTRNKHFSSLAHPSPKKVFDPASSPPPPPSIPPL